MRLKITRYTTFFKIDLNKSDMKRELFYCRDLVNSLSTINYHTEEKEPFGYTYDGDKIKVPRGLGEDWLKNKLGVEGKIHDGVVFPYDKQKYFSINKKPFPEQMKVITLALKHLMHGGTQVILNMPTGRGKTFTAVAIASQLGCNLLILVKTNTLLNQWAGPEGAFVKHTKLKQKYVLAMNGSKWFYQTCDDSNGDLGYKVFVTTHATLRSIAEQKGMRFIAEWCMHNKIGCKIFDEFDTEVDSMLRLDFSTSVRYNIYLSATTFKNGMYDDMVFQRMIKDIPQYGKEFYTEKPNRIGYFYGYYTNPSREDRGKCYNYKGQFVPNNHMAIAIKSEGYFDMLRHIITKHAMPIYNMDKGHKCVIMVGKIESCAIVKEWLLNNFKIKPNHIAEFHSEISKPEKEIALTKPFIVSITDSIGRGLDIERIKLTIDMETYAGGSIFKQATGRNGRVGGEEGIFIKAIDKSFANTLKYYFRLKRLFDEEFKDYHEFNLKWEEKENGE